MDPTSAITLVIDRLTARYGLSPTAALGVLTRAADRKRTDPGLLASRILLGA